MGGLSLTLDEAVDAFSVYRPSYRTPVRVFVREFGLMDVASVQPELTLAFIRQLYEGGFAGRTVHRYHQAVNAFLFWLHEQAEILNPNRRRPPEYVSDEDVKGILDAAYGVRVPQDITLPLNKRRHLERLRNIALLESLRATGARASEIVELVRGDLEVEHQRAVAPDGRYLYFDVRAWAALANYLEARNEDCSLPLFSWSTPVFVRHDVAGDGRNVKLRAKAVQAVIRKLRGSSGITAHGFRNRFARKVLESSADPVATAELMGISAARFRQRFKGEIARVREGLD